jgi:hypothetical protein
VLGVVEQLVRRVNEASGRGDGTGDGEEEEKGRVEGEKLGEWAHWGATTQVRHISFL